MAIYGQPNSWTCGPFALKHALLALGVFAREDDLARLARSTERYGTDERGLGRAARAHGVELRLRRETEPAAARRALEPWLDAGTPVLLCIDQWDHWVTAVSADAEQVFVFDSKYDAPFRAEAWGPFLERLACRRRYLRGLWTRTLYDLHPVLPRHAPRLRLALTPERARRLLDAEHAGLARRWDEYARAFSRLAATPGDQLELGEELERFIAGRRDAIVDRVVDARGEAAVRPDAARLADELAFAAGMYRAVLRPEAERAAEERLATIVMEALDAGASRFPFATSS